MKSPDIQRKHFNKISAVYVRTRSNPYHLTYKKMWWQTYFPWLLTKLPSNAIGLDAMCGNAEVAMYLMDQLPTITMDAFDYSDQMVRYAKKAVGKRAIHVWKDDIINLKTRKKYDFVVILGGLHHVPDHTARVLANLNHLLKKGGYFLNLEPTQNNPFLKWARKRIYHTNPIFEENTERAFDLATYNAFLRQAGFAIRRQEHPGLLGYVLFYNPDAFPLLTIPSIHLARALATADIALGKTWVGKTWSFATWTLAQKL